MLHSMRAKLAFLFFIVPLFYCISAGVDGWPFSNFPLFAKKYELGYFENVHLYVVTHEGKRTRLSAKVLYPLSVARAPKRISHYLSQSNSAEKIDLLLEHYANKMKLSNKNGQGAHPRPWKIQVGRTTGVSRVSENKIVNEVLTYHSLAEIVVFEKP